MIAKAIGANVIAIDIQSSRLSVARALGAIELIDATRVDPVSRILEITGRGARVSVDALGSHQTCINSIRCLAKRGRHVQVGLMLGDQQNPSIPMSVVIAKELEVYGSHGMQAFEYGRMLGMIGSGSLDPAKLISDVVSLEVGSQLLTELDSFPNRGITVIEL
jgi:alcohol dehydrogenase